MQLQVVTRCGWIFRFICLGLLLLLFTCPTRGAEYNTDTTYNGTTNYIVGNIHIPPSGTGTNNSLQILNGAFVTNNLGGTIGSGIGGSNNWGIVSGTGSVWQIGQGFYVGKDGSYNRLTITNGGVVTLMTSDLSVGGSASGIGNQVYVDGVGSVLNVSNVNRYLFVGTGSTGQVTSNQVSVSNGGSLNAYNIRVGQVSSSNTLTIASGGQLLVTNTLDVGYSGNNNTFKVSGSNTLATVQSLEVGYGTSTNNAAWIDTGARLEAGSIFLGVFTANGSSNNTLTVTGSNTVLHSTKEVDVGNAGGYAQLTVSNGAVFTADGTLGLYLGKTATSPGNQLLVTGPNSVLNATNVNAVLYVGYLSTDNQLIISNAAQVNAYYVRLSGANLGVGASNNTLTVIDGGRLVAANNIEVGYTAGYQSLRVSGSNSYVSSAVQFDVGNGTSSNQVTIENGGRVDAPYGLISLGAGTNNLLTVTGAGSVLSNWTKTSVGYSGSNATLIVSNGGRVDSGTAYIGDGALGAPINNRAEVTGTGSVWNSSGNFYVGNVSRDNTLVISNGGSVVSAGNVYVGYANAGSSNNNAVVTGSSSLLKVGGFLSVGANGTSLGSNSFLVVSDGATVECNDIRTPTLITGGAISNLGGVFQFTSASPTFTASGQTVLSNGTISYRNVNGADINNTQVGRVMKQGDNTFQLNNSTNAAASYTFDTGNPSNYYRLVLVNGGNLWQGANLNVGTNGKLLASNTIGRVSALVTNLGTIEVYHSTMTFVSNVVLSGKYISDPSTNYFMADLTVNQSGTLAGGVGDRFEFIKSSLFIHSTNNTGFNLASSSVAFTGGGMHTNAITGVDLGSNVTALASAFEAQDNFAYGELHLGSTTDQVCFTCGNIPTIASNGLYVGWLDLLGNANLWTNLHAAAGINIYYNQTDSRNAYLGGLSYQLTDCSFVSGGGWLYPVIPEPSALAFLSMGSILFLWRKRR